MRYWNRHVTRLADSIRASGEGYTVPLVRAMIEKDLAQWHGFEACAVVTQVLKRSTGDICSIWLVAGTMEQLPSVEDQIAEWARSAGCVAMQFSGRRGWLKMLPHWDEVATVGRRSLKLSE
jgi:7-keto-8-aminopelargonate synthetase-like enzyme